MTDQTAPRSRLAVGLISGTSMDGVDAALVRLSGSPNRPRVRLVAFLSLPYPQRVRDELLRIAGGGSTTAEEISRLDFMLGEAFAEAALRVCRKGRVALRRLAVVGSHGQTLYHQGRPLRISNLGKSARPNTLQIAEAAVIAERTGVPVVSDFRAADMAAGGQGAPLVPMVDYLLLRQKREGVVALNVGGIANVTVIPASAHPREVFGFDTGPGNMVMDGLVRYFTKGRKRFDAGGRWAARGKVLEPRVSRMLESPFFRQEPPKSAGREQFGLRFIGTYLLSRPQARPEDLLRTATELTARSVSYALERFAFPKASVHRLIVSGGGAHNRQLLCRLGELLPRLAIQLSDQYGLPVDAKEAIAFALLADRTLRGLAGNLPGVTGARRAVVLGKVSRP